MDADKTTTLTNALNLLQKVLSAGETKFNRNDWQMLQVARFLVSKEKFIKRDADNTLLHYADISSFYYIDELSDDVYSLAKYIYDNDRTLVIDRTKRVDFGIPLNPKFASYTNPTFEEAVIIINMVRNAIAHGKAIIDFDRSVLVIDNKMMLETNPNVVKYYLDVELPIAMLSKLDVANMIKKNEPTFKRMIYRAIAHKNYSLDGDKFVLSIDHNGSTINLSLTSKEFMDIYASYDQEVKQEYKIEKQIEEKGYDRFKNFKLQRGPGTYYISKSTLFNEFKTQKDTKDLNSIIDLIRETPHKVIDPNLVKRFLDLVDSEYIAYEERKNAMEFYNRVLKSISFQVKTEEQIDSISYILGIDEEEKSLNFVALYNYMTLLFSSYPLKEGNAMLTEFIDLSTLSVDLANTRDIDISSFYSDVEKIIINHLSFYSSRPEQYTHEMPCLTEYLRCLTEVLRKFKTRNNAYIRHIRNSLEHSDITLDGNIVELRDYIQNGDTVDKTFRSRIGLNKLIALSAAYTFIYDIPTYKDYQTFIQNEQNSFLSFSFVDMFKELGKGIDVSVLQQFIDMINTLSINGLGREFDINDSIVDLIEELPYAISEAKKKKRGSK